MELIQEGRLDVHLSHRGLSHQFNRLVLGLLTSSLLLGSSILMASKVPPLLFTNGGPSGSSGSIDHGISRLSNLLLSCDADPASYQQIWPSGHTQQMTSLIDLRVSFASLQRGQRKQFPYRYERQCIDWKKPGEPHTTGRPKHSLVGSTIFIRPFSSKPSFDSLARIKSPVSAKIRTGRCFDHKCGSVCSPSLPPPVSWYVSQNRLPSGIDRNELATAIVSP